MFTGKKVRRYVLGLERVMRLVEGMELAECNEIEDSDYSGYLID